MSAIAIITGASRGLGAALARATAAPGVEQLLLARTTLDLHDVRTECERRGARVHTVAVDLADREAERVVEQAAGVLDWAHAERATLFNNASQVTPIRELQDLRAADLEIAIRVNLSAVIWITSLYLRWCRAHDIAHADVVNISTGVSISPLVGWSLYCSSKAAVNLLAMCVTQETASWPHPVRAVALNPGPLDTEMQREIRQAEFPDHARFMSLFEAGRLASPDEVARKVLDLLRAEPFPQGQFVDLRHR